MERPTIVDVAEAAGVGASTVSRYVRGAKSVSSGVARRIETAIAQLGYQPNVLARGLRVGHTRVIGVLFPHVSNMFYANALGAIETEAHRQGFTVLLLTHNEDRQLQETQLSTLKRFQCDGIILIAAAETDAARVQEILGSTALVALDRPLGKKWDSVTLQNYKAARIITEHLVRHGHRYIVAITAPYRIDTLIQRQRGYRDALRHAGLHAQVVALREPEQLRQELLHLFQSGHSPALLSLSHSVTVAALLGLRESGFSLRSTAFAAVDDLEFATLLDPPLTTLVQPAEQLALLALERLLLRMRGGEGEVSHLRLPGKLVVRESCGCVGTPDRPGQEAVIGD